MSDRLKVSENGRFLIYEDGQPFFYLGDTAWELFHRLDREEASLYLRDRAEKKFTVIQAVALAEFDGLTVPNPYGHTPLTDNDPTRPNEAYFQHVDFIVDTAASLGLFVGMLPSWGDKVNRKWGGGPEIFTPENAAVYGEYLGKRYRDKPLIWILGGDRPPETEAHYAIWRAMAQGLRRGDDGNHLLTFHPMGEEKSSRYFHADTWLDFNMIQSGHNRRDIANYAMITEDYALSPPKPCMDAEPCYEDHPINWNADNGYFDAYDARKAAYWALFAGAHGHTYGCHPIWQMWEPKRDPIAYARTPWQEALHLPGAAQMQHARRLLESRPFLLRLPDQSVLASESGQGADHAQACRASDGSYAFLYTPSGAPLDVEMSKIGGDRVKAAWYDPRAGSALPLGEYAARGIQTFTPPTSGPGEDWMLALDDVAREFPAL